MPRREIISFEAEKKEILHFLERLKVAGSLRVRLGNDVYTINMAVEKASDEGREFLAKGGPGGL